MERTLVVLKPDAVQRGISGEIIQRFEKIGLKIIGARMFIVDKELAAKHYPKERNAFIDGMAKHTIEGYKNLGLDVKEHFGTDELHAIGLKLRDWLVDYISSGPVLALVLEGPHAIEIVRKLVGTTSPAGAQPGTVRGDYSFDSPVIANISKRPIRNLVHASGNPEEAEFEIGLWFKPTELFNYDGIHQKQMLS